MSQLPSHHLESIYTHRLFGLAITVRDACDRLFESIAAPPPGQGRIMVKPELMGLIENALVAGANIRKLLHPPKERGSSESAGAFRVRQRRTKALLATIEGLDTSEIRNTSARNAIEHLDQKVDELAARLNTGEHVADTVVFNMILSHSTILDQFGLGEQLPILYYVARDREVRMLKHRVNMQKLREEAAAIEARLRPLLTPPDQSDGGAGGMMVILRKPPQP